MASLTYLRGSAAATGYVRVGHNSSGTNPDAVWKFTIDQTGASAITALKFTLKWDNDAAGTGWSGAYPYSFQISTSGAAGNTAAGGSNSVQLTLSGSKGTATGTITGLKIASGSTLYLRANCRYNQTSTMKAFATSGGTITVADYTKKTCKVIFNRNTSTSDTTTTSKTYTYGMSGQKFPTPPTSWTKKGYRKIGWSWDRAYGTTSDYTLNNDVSNKWINTHAPSTTLYLTWAVNTVNIKYDPNGGTINSSTYSIQNISGNNRIVKNNSDIIQVGTYGQKTAPLSDTDFGLSKTGYNFGNWKLNKSDTVMIAGTEYGSTSYPAYSDETKTTENYNNFNCLLTAIWNAKTFTVTFNPNGNGATVDTTTKTVTYDTTYGELPIPTRAGYNFTGWYTDATAGTKINEDDTVDILSDITLYAQWSASILPSFERGVLGDFLPNENAYYIYFYVKNSEVVDSAVCDFLNGNNLIDTVDMESGNWTIDTSIYNYRAKYDITANGCINGIRNIGKLNSSINSSAYYSYLQPILVLGSSAAGSFDINKEAARVLNDTTISEKLNVEQSCYWLDYWQQNFDTTTKINHNAYTGAFTCNKDYITYSVKSSTISFSATYVPRQLSISYPDDTVLYTYDEENPQYFKTINPIDYDGDGYFIDREFYWDSVFYGKVNGNTEIDFSRLNGINRRNYPISILYNKHKSGLYKVEIDPIGQGLSDFKIKGGQVYIKVNGFIKNGTIYIKKGTELIPVRLEE